MTVQEGYQEGFTDGRKWWVRHLREINDEVSARDFESTNESSPDWNPPNVCQENAKMQIRITESVWEKVKYIIEGEVLEEMKRMGVLS